MAGSHVRPEGGRGGAVRPAARRGRLLDVAVKSGSNQAMTEPTDPGMAPAPPPVRSIGSATPPELPHAREPGASCLNCGARLQGPYCHACGQDAHVTRTLLHVVEEVIHGITHFDGRAVRSLPMLAFRPGTLTRHYVHGKRARYLPPFAMFLFSVFSMFLVFALTDGPGFVHVNDATGSTTITASGDRSRAQVDPARAGAGLAQAREALVQATAERDSLPPDAGSDARAAATAAVIEARAALQAAERLAAPPVQARGGTGGANPAAATAPDGAPSARAPAERAAEPEGRDVLAALKEEMRAGGIGITTPWPDLDKKVAEKLENPDLLLYKLLNTAYKFSFLLIPISIPFLWLMLFWKRDITLYDHAVFSLYSLSFMTLFVLAASLAARWIDDGWIMQALLWVPPLHLFFQFKGAYALGWTGAAWRTIVFVLMFAWMAMALFGLSVLALGLLD